MARTMTLLETEGDDYVMSVLRALVDKTMREKGWRAPQLAEAMGCSEDLARRWLRGERRLQVEDVVRLAEISGADLNELFALQPRNPRIQLNEDDLRRLVREEMSRATRGVLMAILLGMDRDIDSQPEEIRRPEGIAEPTPSDRQAEPDTVSSREAIPSDALESISRIIEKQPQRTRVRRRYK